jgi:hypothetical protein
VTVETYNIALGNFSYYRLDGPTVVYHVRDIILLCAPHMVEGEYTRVTRSAILTRMRVEIIINVLPVFFSGIEFCNAIYVLYLVSVLFA